MKHLVLLSTLDTEVSEAEVTLMERYGAALGIEERAVHNLGHVLAGYGTDPAGELKVAGFQAGYMEEDPLVMYLMIAMLFQLGVEPIAEMRRVEPARGMLDLDTLLEAVRRGQGLRVNLLHWDPWPHMSRSLEEVRTELGVPPLA